MKKWNVFRHSIISSHPCLYALGVIDPFVYERNLWEQGRGQRVLTGSEELSGVGARVLRGGTTHYFESRANRKYTCFSRASPNRYWSGGSMLYMKRISRSRSRSPETRQNYSYYFGSKRAKWKYTWFSSFTTEGKYCCCTTPVRMLRVKFLQND